MKKIGLFLGTPTSGFGNFQYNLSILEATASLPKDDYEVVIVYVHGSWRSYLKDYPLTSIHMPGGFWGRAFGKALRLGGLPMKWYRAISPYFHPLVRILVSLNCDIWIFPSQDSLAFQTPVPFLSSIHDLMHRYESRFPEVSAGGEYRKREELFTNIFRWAEGVLVDSEMGKRHVEESYGMNPQQIHVLPYIPPKYIYSSRKINNLDSRYKLPEKFLFYPAQFWEHKNHRGLIQAVSSLKKKIPELKLVLVGSPKNAYRSTLRLVDKLNLNDSVFFLGYIPDADVPEFYRRARALVMPTFLGPTNIPPLEAMALGCPVAISGIYGMREQLQDAALYFNPASVEEITQAIELLWQDDQLCEMLSQSGLNRSQQWNQHHFNKRLKDIIDAVLA